MDLERYLRSGRGIVDRCLDRLLPQPEGPAEKVVRAMRYAVMGGGKRLRPILAMASCEACGGRRKHIVEAAAALEMVHTYSLIHDDLPAMDDDDLRRGRATVHCAFGEAEAVLAGDALLTLAFEVLAAYPSGTDRAGQRSRAVVAVAGGAGVAGMVGGQTADLEAEERGADPQTLEWIHKRKTGALFSAAAEVGAIHAGANDEATRALSRYGEMLGLAFQIADDILDVTSTAEELGKTPGKDARDGKATYPSLFGLEASRREASLRVDAAVAELARLGDPDPTLEALARFAVSRTR